MTRYDYRIRRQLFQRRTERFQNFDALEQRYRSRKRTTNIVRFLIILIALIILVGILVFTAKADNHNYKSPVTKGQPEVKLKFPQKDL